LLGHSCENLPRGDTPRQQGSVPGNGATKEVRRQDRELVNSAVRDAVMATWNRPD
jgi:hypothetical protein